MTKGIFLKSSKNPKIFILKSYEQFNVFNTYRFIKIQSVFIRGKGNTFSDIFNKNNSSITFFTS